MKSICLKYGLVVIGTIITAFGVALILIANIGADPISTFLLGWLQFIPIRFGTASQLFSVSLLIINYFLDSKNIGIGSVIYSVGCGIFINMFLALNFSVIAFIPNIFMALAGVIAFSGGIALYLYTNTGAGPLEGLMIYFSEKRNISLKSTRIVLDALLVMIGMMMGGKFGLGTFLCIFLTGPLIEITLNRLNRVSLC